MADDRTDLTAEDGALIASPPATILGKLEVRGIGIMTLPSVARARVGMAVDLVDPSSVERLPKGQRCSYLGIDLPLIAVAPFEASAPAKLRAAARALVAGRPAGAVTA